MMMGFGFIGLILLLILGGGLIALVVLLINRMNPNFRETTTKQTKPNLLPRDILDQRYASGEIEREQYDQMKKDLSD